MDALLQKALRGELGSPDPGDPVEATFKNQLAVPLYLYWVDPEGRHQPLKHEGKQVQVNPDDVCALKAYAGQAFLFTTVASGAVVAVIAVEQGKEAYDIDATVLTRPNAIGDLPVPAGGAKIPTDSPRILVGCGHAPSGNPLTREQFWMRMPDSYCLAPQSSMTVGYTSTYGKQQVTSQQDQVSSSVSASASAGWGPISASLSASLSAASTTFQQFTITEQTSRYESLVLENKTELPQMFLKWQLTDVVTVFDRNDPGKVLASVVMATPPVLIAGPYDPNKPPERAAFPALSPEATAKRPVILGKPLVRMVAP